jgi:transposase
MVNSRGNWSGGFICIDDQAVLSVLVNVECSPKKIAPIYIQMMSVNEKGRDGHDIGIQFIAACSTGTNVPLRGEVKR